MCVVLSVCLYVHVSCHASHSILQCLQFYTIIHVHVYTVHVHVYAHVSFGLFLKKHIWATHTQEAGLVRHVSSNPWIVRVHTCNLRGAHTHDVCKPTPVQNKYLWCDLVWCQFESSLMRKEHHVITTCNEASQRPTITKPQLSPITDAEVSTHYNTT